MNEPFDPAHSAGAGARRATMWVFRVVPVAPTVGVRACAALLLCLALAGCRHKALWTPPATVTAPVDLQDIPEPGNQPLIAELPAPDLVPVRPPEPPKKPSRKKPTAAVKEPTAQPPTQVASVTPEEPAALAIGSLSTGGDATPQAQQQARDLISSIQKRIAALPKATLSQEKAHVRQVNRFLKQAQQALDSGDADGAVNLATKARLIMDDVEKK